MSLELLAGLLCIAMIVGAFLGYAGFVIYMAKDHL